MLIILLRSPIYLFISAALSCYLNLRVAGSRRASRIIIKILSLLRLKCLNKPKLLRLDLNGTFGVVCDSKVVLPIAIPEEPSSDGPAKYSERFRPATRRRCNKTSVVILLSIF